MANTTINVGEKLLSKDLPILLDKYWDKALKSNVVTIDLSETEWISNSEVLFLIGLCNYLVELDKVVYWQMPMASNLTNDSRKYRRRSFFQSKLWYDWKIKQHLSDGVNILSGKIPLKASNTETINEVVKIPIKQYTAEGFDELFYQLYDDSNLGIYRNHKSLLKTTELNHLDSDFLNYSIIKELYSNVCIHAGLTDKDHCYYSLSINRKIPEAKAGPDVLKERLAELSHMEKDFFSERGEYRNINYVELNFQDFGNGIAHSLREKYQQDTNELENYLDDEYEIHKSGNEDSRILHYALLLFTSQYEVDKKFEIHDYIPRGLYIVKELAEKYQGYFEIYSGCGAISVSYRDGHKTIQLAPTSQERTTFKGTRLRIVFPSKDSFKRIDAKRNKLPETASEKHTKPQYVNLLELFTQIESEISAAAKSEPESQVLLLSRFFDKVSKNINTCSKGGLIVVDFAGFGRDLRDIFSKFIYFISHTPSNSRYRIVLINVLVKGLNSTYILNQSKVKREGFSPYPVPIVYPTLDIDWLGIEDNDLAGTLFDIWKGDTSRSLFTEDTVLKHVSSIIEVEHTINGYDITVNLPLFQEFIEQVDSFVTNFFEIEISKNKIDYDYLKNEDHNYNLVKKEKENVVFHNSYGSYQSSYLSFNDKLYIKTYRRLIACYLIFKYYSYTPAGALSGFELPEISEADKILSVTLSSQFIAFEVQKVFKELFEKNIEIIALSNYYTFYNERRFKEINKGDNVLVINDIVSTGKLTENIFNSLEKIEAKPICCLSIADLRRSELISFDYPISSITKFSISRKHNKHPKNEVEWINPILNTPVTIKRESRNLNTLLTKTEFLDAISESDILIGNMKESSYNLLYFLNTHQLLKKDKELQFKFLKLILDRLKRKKEESNRTDLANILRGLDIIIENFSDRRIKEQVNKLVSGISALNHPSIFHDYHIDIIFYPFLSNISIIEDHTNMFEEIGRDERLPWILPIPRILTEKGWRFTFPPKFLNILTEKENPSVLIIDIGSSTGSTLMQMIDSIAFLSVKSIDVLTIFSRLEDYQKEFLTRIKSVKVKHKVVPLNAYFGVHFNLPSLNDRENPFFQEAREIKELIDNYSDYLGPNFLDYIKKLQKTFEDIKYPSELKDDYPLFDGISKKLMIQYRDKIGLFDSYRFYSEDIPDDGDFDYLVDATESKLTLLSVLNLEPSLYKTFKRLLPEVKIKKLWHQTFKLLSEREHTKNSEQQLFLIKALFYLSPEMFTNAQHLHKIVSCAYKNGFERNTYQYISYLLFLVGFGIRTIEDVMVIKGFQVEIINWLLKLQQSNKGLFDEFRFFSEAYRKFIENKGKNTLPPINKYSQLSNYFIKALNNQDRHDEKLLPIQLSKLERNSIDLLYCYDNPDIAEAKEQTPQQETIFENSLDLFKIQYFEEYPEYMYIKNIVENLSSYGVQDLPFGPSKLLSIIERLEGILKEKSLSTEYLLRLNDTITEYKENLLLTSSAFCEFVLHQSSNIKQVWEQCELEMKEPDYIKATIMNSVDYEVKVNRYVLLLAFRNLIKNKAKFAPKAKWEIAVKKLNNDKIDMRVTQHSSFIEGGDGTSYSNIRRFLAENGTFYKRVRKNPFILKIIFPLNIAS